MEQLAKQTAELARRLAAMPPHGARNHAAALDAVELLARRVLKEVTLARGDGSRTIGESSGIWPAMQTTPRR